MKIKIIYKNHLIYIFFLIFMNCAGSILFTNNLDERMSKALVLYDQEKYSKASEEFKYIIFNNPGSSLALKARFYLAESLYKTENYNQASIEYNEFIIRSQDPMLIEKAKFLICRCLYLLSDDYTKDQNETIYTINQIQYYLEEYPLNEHALECENMIISLRTKLAKKQLESGKLYLRTEEYKSAHIYFNIILNEYYDTKYYDDAMMYIILTYVLENDFENAQTYFKNNQLKFLSDLKRQESKEILESIKNGFEIRNYFKLIK